MEPHIVLREALELRKKQSKVLAALWTSCCDAELPTRFTLCGWLKTFSFPIVKLGIHRMGLKSQTASMTTIACIKYASACMWRASGEEGRPTTPRRERNALRRKKVGHVI